MDLRENRGEIEAAEAGKLPRLVEIDDLAGDLHALNQSTADGHNTLEQMALTAMQLGLG